MVLFKRKPVQYLPRPAVYEDQEIWVIDATDELFTNYDDYLSRIEFYKQKRFICEITGHSGLDFFTALSNETSASLEVDDAFPDALREPILRKVQFSTISRIDNLVDHIFDEFKQDFYPGESVTVMLDNGDRLNGVVREKTKFPDLLGPDGKVLRKAFARYFVSLTSRPDKEALVDPEHIVRDRKTFTKQMLRSFLKNAVNREAWTGAPWLVKAKYASDYRISTEIPSHLRYEHQVAQRKANLTVKKSDYDGTLLSFFAPQGRLPELKPKSHKGKGSQNDSVRSRQEQFLEYSLALTGNSTLSFERSVPLNPNDPQYIQFINQHPSFPTIAVRGLPKPPPPPPIKYPIEDLEIPPGKELSARPQMNFLSDDVPLPGHPAETSKTGIKMESVGLLLETWDTLNVYCEVYQLDSFTFDDYVQALQITSEEVQCEILVEIHCAILKKLVNHEKDLNGQVQINLPAAAQDESDIGSSRDGSNAPTPTPEPETKPRTTRSSLAKAEAAEAKAAAAVDAKLHRASEVDQCVRGYGWRARLRKRDFANGRWIVIVVGLLNLFTANPRQRKACDEILTELAPSNMNPTEDTVISQYAKLDINTRVKIIQFLCMLSLETQAIRGYMEDCTSQMTQFRKEKVEWQRSRKAAIEELRVLNEERKALQPEEVSPIPELDDMEDMEDLKVGGPEVEDDGDTIMESDEEGPVQQRSLRRANDRAVERKRKLEEERERKEKAELERAKKPSKEARRLEKVLKKIEEVKDHVKECEDEIATLDNDLREADCPRTRVLGKDRFWNRYYWMERNAMPYAGLPTSSTANAGYANGCIWVQGPDDIERQGFIELDDWGNYRYRQAFHMTVPERKMIEEGNTHVFTAHQWGYYDDPDQLDKLIGWLDIRGVREIKLRKELQAQREKISFHMEQRKQYVSRVNAERLETGETATRISTRTKTYSEPSPHRCVAWRNTMALEEIGYLHSEPPKGQKKGVARVSTRKSGAEDEGRQTSMATRSGKPLTRQGSRYNF